jgi:Family of unknown function (DUF5681)
MLIWPTVPIHPRMRALTHRRRGFAIARVRLEEGPLMSKSSKSAVQSGYKIGKGRPPRHTRWEKGMSGNPGGKKKGTLNLESTFRESLLRQVTVTVDGEKKVISVLEALVMRLLDAGIKGDVKVINSILDRIEPLMGSDQRQDTETSAEDIQILQRVLVERDFSGLSDVVLERSDTGEETDEKDLAPDAQEETRD